MIGTSRLEYVFIQICILGLHYFAPLCLLYCTLIVGLYGQKNIVMSPLPLIIELLAGAEALFFVFVYLPSRCYLQREAVHPPAPRRQQRKELFYRCNENIANPEEYLRKWFLGAELKDIKRENLKEFLLWAFFNRGGPPGDDDEELEEYVDATEKLLGRPIETGTGKAKCLRLTLDRVNMLHRSLLWYFCVGFVDFLAYLKLLYHGFHFHRTALSRFFTLFPFRPQSLFTTYHSPAKHTTYWHRPHKSSTKLPIVFIHGIGIGLYPYTNFLDQLNSINAVEPTDPDGQVGIIAIEVMPVSFRITHAALTKSEMCSEIEQILLKHLTPGQKCVLVSHSYGSVVTTHLLHTPSTAAMIGPVVLIDPVTVLLHLPDVAYNFVRRKPRKANEHQLYYFASMDMGVSHTLGRQFFWNQNVLWKQDLEGRRVTVSLSGKDLIVDTEAVGRYLSKDSVVPNYRANPSGNGGRVLIDFEGRVDTQEPTMRVGGGDCQENKETRGCSKNGSSELELDQEEWKSRPWRGTGIDILWFKDLDHAQVFDAHATRQKIIDAISVYCGGEE
ncbi:transcription initiation protein spt5 [Diplocarpon rosae]|nr:transcription initiation protein spt5 [Diplocarpon rosae]